jgi:CHAT domain-containing protein
MYEYKLKFHDDKGVEKGWMMSQTIKNFEALRNYNKSVFAKLFLSNQALKTKIENTDTYDITELHALNNYCEKLDLSNKLFLHPPTIKELQQNLLPNELYISFSFSLNDRSFLIIKIKKNSSEVLKSKITSFELINRIALIKGIFEKDSSLIINAAVNLSRTTENIPQTDLSTNLSVLEKTLVDAIGISPNEKLIIENDIFISQVPFDILKNSRTNRYLIQDNDITYTPNAEYFLKLRKKNKPLVFSSVLAMAPSEKKGEQEIVDEVQNISQSFPKTSEIETNITRSKFLQIISQNKNFDIIHLSSHYRKQFIDNTTKQTPVEITGYNVQQLEKPKGVYFFELNGTSVFAEDILEVNKLSTSLLILSGCETAASDDVLGVIQPIALAWKENRSVNDSTYIILNGGCYCNSTESFSNLSLTSLPFGAKYTIAFQNKISLQASEQFFGQFYEYLNKFNDVPKAFRLTKLSFLNSLDENEFDHFLIILISD